MQIASAKSCKIQEKIGKIGDKAFVRSAVLLSGVAMCIPVSATAQTVQPSSERGIEEIVVTAQKREESLQQTPISIAVMSADTLNQRGIHSVMDLAGGAVPSVRIAPFAGRSSAAMIGMRGMVPTDATQISRDTTVGVYIDGVYLGRVQGLGTELADVQRIEVLRGPQGTLFGRNAVGGALNIVTKKPTGEWGADLTAGIRNWDGYNIAAHVNLPEVAGISVKLDGLYNKRDGWVKNPMPGQEDWNAIKRYGFRVSALWEPLDGLSVFYAYDRSTDKSTVGYPHMEYIVPGSPPLAPMFKADGGRTRKARGGFVLDPSTGKTSGHTLNAEWKVSDALTVRSITAYRKLDQFQSDNSAGSFLAFRPNGFEGRLSMANVKQDQFSQELQLIGSYDHLTYVLGAFYFEEDATDDAYAPYTAQFNADGTALLPLAAPYSSTGYPDRASEAHARSKALFGQAAWTPAFADERLHLTVGLRYTDDKKHGRLTKLRGKDAPDYMRFKFGSKRVDPAATLAFDINDTLHTYLRWGNAYRAGGANSRSATFRTFAEETVSTWELGLKSELFDRRARLNLAFYQTTLKDMQLDFVSPANPSASETVNGQRKEKIKGIEADLTIAPGGGFTINGSYSYTDASLRRQLNPFTNKYEQFHVAITPKHALTMAVDYEVPLGDWATLRAHVDGNWSSGHYGTPTEPSLSKKVALINGRLSLADIEAGPGKVELSLWGKNLTNAEYLLYDFELTAAGLSGANQGHYNEPRTYGFDVRYQF